LGDARTVGVNLVGYLTTESGVGEAARLMVRALDAAKLPRVLINFDQSYNLRRSDVTFADFSDDNPHAVNLIHINADQADVFAASRARFFEGKYNVGFWMWELPDFPSEWSGSFRYFDEIWAASAFAVEAIAKASPIPTVKVPPPILEYRGRLLGRDYFGLQPDKFTFLFLFDFMSVFERKNPLAVVRAFKRAFENDDRAALVLKCANASADPVKAARLRDAAQHPSIRVIDGYMSREEIASLTHACDVYVSLHRSEGYGLTIAEAMMAARPVIATPYSGSADFTTVGNSLPVRYRLVELEKDEGPYRRGSFWAEPDIDHAAELMRWAFDHRDASAQLGAQAKQYITEVFSPEAVGRLVKARLAVIARAKGLQISQAR
jgi:glycosyltransferase involved in cell wall biosynthesis